METSLVRVETRALDIARKFYVDRGFAVEDVSRKRGHNGYDFLVRNENQELRIEVKGCSRAWGIPDLFATEFDDQHRLIADILCVVYLLKDRPPQICLIPRSAIPPELVVPKRTFRISGKFKKQSVLEQFIQPHTPQEE